ncbi:hypothetical protein ACHAWF_009378, partial [Thalassiosira exigua]
GTKPTSREDGGGSPDGGRGGYRTVLPLSLFLAGIATLLFPLAATLGGPSWASLDRFCLGLFEGLLLPAAMAGVSDATADVVEAETPNLDGKPSHGGEDETVERSDVKATSSSIVIAGCYLGSAWAYLSAWVLFSEGFQIQMAEWGYDGPIWPSVFYVNGALSMGCLLLFRDEFDFGILGGVAGKLSSGTGKNENVRAAVAETHSDQLLDGGNLWKETVSIAKETLASKSGRAVLAAQVGQGALLYSIASFGPLYLERVGGASVADQDSDVASAALSESVASSVSSVAVTASIAASNLILPQIAQALVGVSIGAAADKVSSEIGARVTRRALQLTSGVVPAVILWYLSRVGSGEGGDGLASAALLFGTAQTVSALSLGAVSVSHLEIATPSSAGAVYALGNVAAAASGSVVVNLFGRLLEGDTTSTGSAGASLSEMSDGTGGAEFALPFRVVAALSAVGSLVYGSTVETEVEIGFNSTYM